MTYLKTLFIIFFYTIFISGCSQKLNKIQKVESNKKIVEITNKLIQNCLNSDENSSIFIKNRQTYVEINSNNDTDFRKGSYILTMESKNKFSCVTPILKEQKGIFILITGHANENSDKQKNQHLSDNRAISLAELFYNVGIRDEIFAKGCSDKNSSVGRKINIYVHSNKSTIINHCK